MSWRPNKRSSYAVKRNLVSIAIAIGVGGMIFFWFLIEKQNKITFLSTIESKLVDQRIRRRGPRSPGEDVVIIAIDSKSTEKLGRWPWSRKVHANLIDRLREWGASTVAFDVLFTEIEGTYEAERLHRIKATLPAGETVAATREAIDTALAEVEVDKVFSKALEKTYDADAALTVLAFNFIYPEDLDHVGQLGAVLDAEGEQVVLDIASFSSRDENVAVMRNQPPKLALGIRPVIAELAEWTAALGFANPIYDSDGVIRHEQLVVVYSPAIREAIENDASPAAAITQPEARVQAYMSLATAAVATHLRLRSNQVILDLNKGEIHLQIPDREPLVHFFDPFDGTARIDYCGGSQTFPTYSFVDVLNNEIVDNAGRPISGRDAFEGKLVFVGATDFGLGDFFVTPFTSALPGVEKHANVAENLLNGHQLRTHHDEILIIGISLLVTAIFVAVLAANFGSLTAGFGLVIATVSFLGLTFLDLTRNGIIWNWTLPLLTLLLGYGGVGAYRAATEQRAKRAMKARGAFIKETFGRYLSEQVVNLIVDDPSGLNLGGERRRITIMMSDLRGFTAMCERSSPEDVVGILNLYLGRMTDIIFKYGGTIDEFIGDAILALFGAPVAKDDDAARAIACAIEMQLAMDEVNVALEEKGLPQVEMGIALNTGEVIVGNIGSEKRTKYGVVGTNINVTSRIESFTVGGQVFISEETLHEAGDDLVTTGAKIEVKAKGLAAPIAAYDVRGIAAPYSLLMPVITESFHQLSQEIRAHVTILEGKHVGEETIDAEFVCLSTVGADLRCCVELEPMANIKLRVEDEEGKIIEEDLYAKVIDRPATEGCAAIRFTSIPPSVNEFFKKTIKG